MRRRVEEHNGLNENVAPSFIDILIEDLNMSNAIKLVHQLMNVGQAYRKSN